MKPLLPSADRLMPYLKRIDEERYYTNFGPLCLEYESRLADLFGAPCITGSSATSLLTATLMAYDLPKGSFVAMPSWTFPATAAAVVSAGLVPYFFDCLGNGYAPLADAPSCVSAFLIVASFGGPIGNMDGMTYFTDKPIIIDAAAGFDTFSTICKPREIPIVISTHATKVFGTGEGGFVTCNDSALLEKIRRITNFGLTPDRRIEYTGLNAKFSEYHAAVGLAELDGWSSKRKLLLEKTRKYGIDYAITQVPVRGEGRKGIYGCHNHAAYADYPRTSLPVTNDLIENVGVVTVGIE